MGAMEVFLIITAVIVIAVSFCIKEKSDKNEDEKKSGQDEVKAVTQEMIKEEIQNQLAMISDDMLENTEAKLDKIANQKIMAVGNYSEDVLKNIEENHNEVMFLYNMLNEKYIYTHDAYVTYNSGLLIIDLTKRRKSRVICRIILSDKSGEIHLNCIEYYLKENEKILNTFEKSLLAHSVKPETQPIASGVGG